MAEYTYINMNINVNIKCVKIVWDCRYDNNYNDGLTCVIRCYVFVMWTPGMHRSVWLRVCYVDAWYAPINLVTCLLCGRLVCTDQSGYVFVMWRPGMHRSVCLCCRVRTRGWVRVAVVGLSVGPVVATFTCKMSPNSSLNFLCRTYVVI
jgi:hypothetical protein